MKISREGDYALRAVIHMAAKPEGVISTKDEVARAEDIPPKFLSKILQSLVRAGVVASKAGVGGGYRLARSPERISFLEVIEAIEGPLMLNLCCGDFGGCERQGDCNQEWVWREAQRALADHFQRTTLAEAARGAASGQR